MLLGSTALDVAIGLVFIYLVVSLVCSALHEMLEGWLKNRSKDLERGVCEMLTSGATPLNLVEAIYDHPLISGLFKGDYAAAKRMGELPSYIPARNFALALLDTVRSRTASAAARPANQAIELREAALRFAAHNPKVSTALVALIDAAGD